MTGKRGGRAVVAGRRADALAEAAAHTVDLHTDLRSAPVAGDPVLLDRMVRNLIDNAVRYNVIDGLVTVTLRADDRHARIQVINTGARLDPSAVDQLFAPFVRGPAARSSTDEGAGLGLSIVRAVVDAHHGTLSAVAGASGGLDITVELPAAWPPSARTRDAGSAG